MTDPTGMPSALGIEAVEWFAEGGENLTVRVTGRWRRRRPTWSGQPLLVVEAQGRRYRFPAMPEPPSLTGTARGTWRMSFSVPASLAPHLGGRTWLQLGAAAVPLPVEVGSGSEEELVSPEGPAIPGKPEEPAIPGEPEGPAIPGEPVEPAGRSADPSLLAERRLRSSELAVEAARRRAAQAEETAAELASRIEQLERELDAARREPQRLTALLAAREGAQRAAEQRAHAERLLREELQEELAAQMGEQQGVTDTLGELAAVEQRVRELEAEIERLRRRADEAEQLAAAARVARERAERQAAELAASHEPSGAWRGAELASSARLRAELALSGRMPRVTSARVHQSEQAAELPKALRLEREMVSARALAAPRASQSEEGIVAALRRELEVRVAAETHLQGLVASLESGLGARSADESRFASALAQLREELTQLRTIAESERGARQEAEARALQLERKLHDQLARCGRAYDAIDELRVQLEAVRMAQAGWAPDSPLASEPVQPERFSAALSRLREATPVEAVSPEGQLEPELGRSRTARPERDDVPARAWLAHVFRALTDDDAGAAGRLALQLLPAQRLAYPHPIAYDIVLAEIGCVQVSVSSGSLTIELAEGPREPGQVPLQVSGDLASLARLLAAGRMRRRFGRGLARVQGERAALGALLALVRAPLSLGELYGEGVRMEPLLALTVVSLMIDPVWTRGERFTLAHQEWGAGRVGTYLHVRDGQPLSVTESAPLGPVATTIVCSADSLLAVLEGARWSDAALRGDERPLSLLQGWVKRAQSG